MKGHDRDLRAELGLERLAGVDEAGRGPLAGPVTAAAVILPEGDPPAGLDDSKRLSAGRRASLDEWVRANALAWSVIHVSREEIDRLNILQATFVAMRRAVAALDPSPGYVLVDGRDFPLQWPGRALIGGDGISAAIAAASILAKEARDTWMREADQRWPGYGFADHKGYPSPAHLAALQELGPCEIHRRSYAPVRRWFESRGLSSD